MRTRTSGSSARSLRRRSRPAIRCHTVNAFVPVRYEVEQHASTKFPLDGAHAASACRGCHPIDDRLAARVTAAVHKFLRERKRPERFSLAVLHPKKSPQACAECHEDVHRGQFLTAAGANDCAACHKTSSFSDLRFDHDEQSRFPLTGKHAKTACAGCHKTERAGQASFVRYKPLELGCGSCHTDIHQGQFLAAALAPRAQVPAGGVLLVAQAASNRAAAAGDARSVTATSATRQKTSSTPSSITTTAASRPTRSTENT